MTQIALSLTHRLPGGIPLNILTTATRARWLAPLAVSWLALAVPARASTDFITLSAAHCHAVGTTAPLTADMEPYRASVKDCPIARTGQPAKVHLLSVFTDDYYKGRPADAPWQQFPLPLLIDASGRCLGRLPHLFPVDPPQELVVSAGQWRRGMPHELRLQVLSPAVGGNYRLPSLRWDAKQQIYQTKNTPNSPQESAACP